VVITTLGELAMLAAVPNPGTLMLNLGILETLAVEAAVEAGTLATLVVETVVPTSQLTTASTKAVTLVLLLPDLVARSLLK
jgi:hypothetical protein